MAYLIGADGKTIDGDAPMATNHGVEQPGGMRLLSFDHSARRFHRERGHPPIVFSRYVDGASPLLFKAMTEHQEIDGEFAMFTHGDGKQISIEIRGGLIVGQWMHSPRGKALRPYEVITLCYRDITWLHVGSGRMNVA